MSHRPRSAPTRADVARLAGVSESTVSYALSGARSIGEETKERIFAAMAELGYTPNAMARGLAGRKTGLLALMFPASERGFGLTDYEYVHAASERVEQEGYQLLMWPNPVEDLTSLRRIANQHLVDGMILMEVRASDPRPEIIRAANIPHVLIGRTDDPAEVTWVDADFAAWGQVAIDKLADAGHRHIAFVTQPQAIYDLSYGPLLRTEPSLIAHAKARGVRMHIARSEVSIRAGREAFDRLQREHPEVSAIMSFNELAMIGVLEGISSAGKRIPDDFSVLQFGIRGSAAEATVPPQNTVGADGALLGAKAAEFLIARLNGAPAGELTGLVPPIYVDRGSVGPAPRSASNA